MCVRVKRFPEFGVTLNIFSGVLTHDALMRYIDQIEPGDVAIESGEVARWISYLDPTLDLSGLDVARIPMRKRALAARLHALHPGATVRSALVCASPMGELEMDFWPRYVARDDQYPAEPVVFPALDAACAWLELSEGACKAVSDAIVGDQAASVSGRSASDAGRVAPGCGPGAA